MHTLMPRHAPPPPPPSTPRPLVMVRGIADLDRATVATPWAPLVAHLADTAPWVDPAARVAALDPLARRVAHTEKPSRDAARWEAVLRIALTRWTMHGLAAGAALLFDAGCDLRPLRAAMKVVRTATPYTHVLDLVPDVQRAYTLFDEATRSRRVTRCDRDKVALAALGARGNLFVAAMNVEAWAVPGSACAGPAHLLGDTFRMWASTWGLVGFARDRDDAGTLGDGFLAAVAADLNALATAELGR